MIRILPGKKLVRTVLTRLERMVDQRNSIDKGTQLLLRLKFKEMISNGIPLSFDDVGFRAYSQSNEDGILLYIFTVVGETNKYLVDIGSASVNISNSANLIINHGWTGLLIEANAKAVSITNKFYKNCPDTKIFPPTAINEWVTAENINSLISRHGSTGEIDLLTIDIDGMDYWVLKAIECIYPRVIIVEYQDIIGSEKAWVIPYKPDFNANNYEVNSNNPSYLGASLAAFVKLAKQKGYRLVGCNKYGYNAFFVRCGLGEKYLPEVSIESCFKHPLNKLGAEKYFPAVKDMDWVEV